MSRARRTRLPISCEPCRNRKIRCTRDDTPCSTCLRRGVQPSLCVFKKRQPSLDSDTEPSVTATSIEFISEKFATAETGDSHSTSAKLPNDADLAARVLKLEQLLQFQIGSSLMVPTTAYSSTSENEAWETRNQLSQRHIVQRSDHSTRPYGKLQVSSSGHVRFVPPSPWISSGEAGIMDMGDDSQLLDLPEGPYPLGKAHDQEIAACLTPLPSSSLCTRLKDIYFASFAPLFHILNDVTFDRQYKLFQENSDSVTLPWLALLYAMLGTAVTALEADSDILAELSRESTIIGKMAELAERYRKASMRCLEIDNFLWQHNVTTLQSLVILIYGINHSHGQSWSLLGLTQHIALSIGCHVDPAHFGLSRVECEERRRCWAGLRMLYTIQNSVMGNLGPAQFANYSVSPPADIDDSDLVSGLSETLQPRGQATQMSYLLLKFRLYEICSNICTRVLANPNPSLMTIHGLNQDITTERERCRSLYELHNHSESLPLHHKVHVKILNGYSHQLLLLLHRPLLRYSPESDQFHVSCTRCIESARVLLTIHAAFHDSPEFSAFMWYHRGLGSFHAFHAVITLLTIYSLVPSEISYIEISALVQSCLNRFEDMAIQSLICRRAAPVLRHILCRLQSNTSASILTPDSGHSQILNLQNRAITPAQVLETQPQTIYQQQQQKQNHNTVGNSEFITGFDGQLDAFNYLFEQIDPHEWLSPSVMMWNQWDGVINHTNVS